MRGVTAVRGSTDRNHYSVFDYTKLIGSASNQIGRLGSRPIEADNADHNTVLKSDPDTVLEIQFDLDTARARSPRNPQYNRYLDMPQAAV